MDTSSHRLFPRLWSSGPLSVLLLTAMSASAAAQSTPLHVWGFQSGCESKLELTRRVMDRLAADTGYKVERLLSGAAEPLPVCPGPEAMSGQGCGEALGQSCPGGQGLVLGGVLDRQDKATRIRLWLYDLQSGRLAVQDDYCQQCDPDDSKVVAAHAAALLKAPPFGARVSAQPTYCRGGSAVQSTPPASALHLGVFGSSAVRDELRRELARRITLKRSATRQPAPVATEQSGTDPASFENITRREEGSQVLRIELTASAAELYLWDQRSRRGTTRSVACTDGCRDGVEAIAQAAAELLDVCFADRCAQVQSAELRPPAACADFSQQECSALPLSGAGSSGGIDRALATRIEILSGAGVGLSAVVTTGLWIANQTLTVDRVVYGQPVQVEKTLTPAAALATGLTGGLALLSIPVFYYLEKAKHAPAPTAGAAKAAAPAGLLKCPMPGVSTALLTRRSRS